MRYSKYLGFGDAYIANLIGCDKSIIVKKERLSA